MDRQRVTSRQAFPRAVDRQAVIMAANGRCAQCGSMNELLDIRQIISRRDGGGPERGNLEAVCQTCNRMPDLKPSELLFANFVAGLLENHPGYVNVIRELTLADGMPRPDFVTKEIASNRELLVECSSSPVLAGARLENLRGQLRAYRAAASGRTIVLTFPGRTTPEATRALGADGVELWDIDTIDSKFAEQIAAMQDGYYPRLISDAIARTRPEDRALAQIRALPPGKDDWSTYQKLVGRLLEMLFCPPLESGLGEEWDFDKVSRRDIIFANHASDGFWAGLRQRYGADYILVDAKNGARVRKADVLQIANYLKPHGLGNFAIIVGRAEVERGVPFVLKEQWSFHGKLILVLNDEDLAEMVGAFGSGRKQTKVLSDKIQAFRISM